MALTEKLGAIGNAIRAKTGGTELLTLDAMPTAIESISGAAEPVIEALSVTSNGTYTASNGVDGYSPVTVNVPQDGSPPESAFVLSGDCSYRFANGGWDWFIENYGDRITTNGISNANNMFYSAEITNIPFELNFKLTSNIGIQKMFYFCNKLTNLPKINNINPSETLYLFNSCLRLRTIPEDFTDTWDWSYIESLTSPYSGSQSDMFNNCYSLRSLPMSLISHCNPYVYESYSYFRYGFGFCCSLDELTNLPIPYTKGTWTRNAFESFVTNCYRLKNITFALQDNGTPYTVSWKSQTIDLSNHTGWVNNKGTILSYNSGITADKEVKDDTTYQALKNDPDWFTTKVEYSRYNHDSAVATINSLPDTSAYLATAGGTNTIKFTANAGSATDGGAINTLTEEEIAVATAKGWTVTLV